MVSVAIVWLTKDDAVLQYFDDDSFLCGAQFTTLDTTYGKFSCIIGYIMSMRSDVVMLRIFGLTVKNNYSTAEIHGCVG